MNTQDLPFSRELLQKMMSESFFFTSSEAEMIAGEKVKSQMEHIILGSSLF